MNISGGYSSASSTTIPGGQHEEMIRAKLQNTLDEIVQVLIRIAMALEKRNS